MIKFVRHKSRDKTAAKGFLKKKGESNDSGTESDGDILDVDKHQHRNLDLDMETSLSSCADAVSPTDTVCSSESSAMMCQSHLLYDQHSSEEELEVINGPSSVAAAEAAAAVSSSSVLMVRGTASSIANSERGSSSLEPDELFGEATTSKRSSSTLGENRKRSLAHSSDDESRNHLEPILTPVNFRTTPPLEAFKPNRSHKFRSTTPLILSEARCGIENMKLCDNSFNNEQKNIDVVKSAKCAAGHNNDANIDYDDDDNDVEIDQQEQHDDNDNDSANTTNNGGNNIINASLKMSNSSHHIYQPLPKYSFHYNSSRSSPASTTGLNVEVRSVSPPAKLFHCAISPKRRPANNNINNNSNNNNNNNNHHHNNNNNNINHDNNTTIIKQQQQQQSTTQQQQHDTQRLQRPHRPCLDFDKMQQVSLH